MTSLSATALIDPLNVDLSIAAEIPIPVSSPEPGLSQTEPVIKDIDDVIAPNLPAPPIPIITPHQPSHISDLETATATSLIYNEEHEQLFSIYGSLSPEFEEYAKFLRKSLNSKKIQSLMEDPTTYLTIQRVKEWIRQQKWPRLPWNSPVYRTRRLRSLLLLPITSKTGSNSSGHCFEKAVAFEQWAVSFGGVASPIPTGAASPLHSMMGIASSAFPQGAQAANLNETGSMGNKFPPMVDQPLFDPEKYPHIVQLYHRYLDYCLDQRYLHNQAASYYDHMNRVFVFPSVFITGLSGIGSFISSSSAIQPEHRIYITLTVGILASINTLIQSFSSAYKFDSKADSHRSAAEVYDQIITSIDFEKSYPDDVNFFKELELKLVDLKNKYKYLVPTWIYDEYYAKKNLYMTNNFVREKIINKMRKDVINDMNECELSVGEVKDRLEEINKMELDLNLNATGEGRRWRSRGGDSLRYRQSSRSCCYIFIVGPINWLTELFGCCQTRHASEMRMAKQKMQYGGT